MKIDKKALFSMGAIVFTLLSMTMSNKAQEEDIKLLKEEIKAELKGEEQC